MHGPTGIVWANLTSFSLKLPWGVYRPDACGRQLAARCAKTDRRNCVRCCEAVQAG